jgi:heat shock protein HslJ
MKSAFNLAGSEWLLEDLAGSGVIDNVQATLAFPEAGKVSGKGSCNRFFGAAEIAGDAIKLGPLGTTRMACPEAVMNQETKYLNALQAAERFEWKDPYLLLHSKGIEKPLRFTRPVAEKK